jgi:hypothetical protein
MADSQVIGLKSILSEARTLESYPQVGGSRTGFMALVSLNHLKGENIHGRNDEFSDGTFEDGYRTV